MRNDLVARAKELGLIEGIKIAFDFHFKEFYGRYAQQKGIGKGPDKSGNLVPGFRPHIAWDVATNAIISIAYYQENRNQGTPYILFCPLIRHWHSHDRGNTYGVPRFKGFDLRIKGNHRIFSKEGVKELINLQPKKGISKNYQVKQVRDIIISYKLGGKTYE